jgi:hypothetical protein
MWALGALAAAVQPLVVLLKPVVQGLLGKATTVLREQVAGLERLQLRVAPVELVFSLQ